MLIHVGFVKYYFTNHFSSWLILPILIWIICHSNNKQCECYTASLFILFSYVFTFGKWCYSSMHTHSLCGLIFSQFSVLEADGKIIKWYAFLYVSSSLLCGLLPSWSLLYRICYHYMLLMSVVRKETFSQYKTLQQSNKNIRWKSSLYKKHD